MFSCRFYLDLSYLSSQLHTRNSSILPQGNLPVCLRDHHHCVARYDSHVRLWMLLRCTDLLSDCNLRRQIGTQPLFFLRCDKWFPRTHCWWCVIERFIRSCLQMSRDFTLGWVKLFQLFIMLLLLKIFYLFCFCSWTVWLDKIMLLIPIQLLQQL